MFRKRQSSSMLVMLREEMGLPVDWRQAGGGWRVSLMSFQPFNFSGGRNLNFPTGGWAYGIPCHVLIAGPSATWWRLPWIIPEVVLMTSPVLAPAMLCPLVGGGPRQVTNPMKVWLKPSIARTKSNMVLYVDDLVRLC